MPGSKHSIPVHIFLVLPSDGKGGAREYLPDGASVPEGMESMTESRGSSPRRKASMNASRNERDSLGDSGSNTPVRSRENSSVSALGASASMVNLNTGRGGSRSSSLDVKRPPATPTPRFETAAQWQRHKRKVLNLPVIVDFHGGSFILGSPSEQAGFCSQMARTLGKHNGCVVISVDYRLGPYSRFPAANEDADYVVKAVLNPDFSAGRVLREDIRRHAEEMHRKEWIDLDTHRLALSGFSSGGNLALNLVINSRNDPTIGRDWLSAVPQEHPFPVPVLLFYPSLDARLLPNERPRPQGLEPATGFFASLKIESELMPKYLPKERRSHPRASPGLVDVANGGLHDKARMLLILPELDSLSEQSQVWVKKVRDDGRGADLEVVDVKGEMHGWTQFPDAWLKSEESKRRKYDCFERAEEFVRHWWFDSQARVGDTTFGTVA